MKDCGPDQMRLVCSGKEITAYKKDTYGISFGNPTLEELDIFDGCVIHFIPDMELIYEQWQEYKHELEKTLKVNKKFTVCVREFSHDDISIENMSSCSTLLELKEAISARRGHDPADIRLVYNGEELTNDDATMEDVDVDNDSVVFMVVRT